MITYVIIFVSRANYRLADIHSFQVSNLSSLCYSKFQANFFTHSNPIRISHGEFIENIR